MVLCFVYLHLRYPKPTDPSRKGFVARFLEAMEARDGNVPWKKIGDK